MLLFWGKPFLLARDHSLYTSRGAASTTSRRFFLPSCTLDIDLWKRTSCLSLSCFHTMLFSVYFKTIWHYFIDFQGSSNKENMCLLYTFPNNFWTSFQRDACCLNVNVLFFFQRKPNMLFVFTGVFILNTFTF